MTALKKLEKWEQPQVQLGLLEVVSSRGPSVPPVTWGSAGNQDTGVPRACPESCLRYLQVRMLGCTDAGFFRL